MSTTHDRPRRFVRRHFWLNTPTQGRFVTFVMLGTALVVVLMSLTVFGVLWTLFLNQTGVPLSVEPSEIFQGAFLQTAIVGGVLYIVFALAGTALSIFLSHKIVGPIHRMNRILKDPRLREGELGNLRRGDALKEFFADFKAFVSEHQQLMKQHEQLAQATSELIDTLPDQARHAPATGRLVERLEETLRRQQPEMVDNQEDPS